MSAVPSNLYRPPVLDWERVLPLKDAAELMGVSVDTLQLRCRDELAMQGMAFYDRPRGGGKPQWFLQTAYDPKLSAEPVADRQREPDLSSFSAVQREAAYARRHCVLKLIEMERSRPGFAAPALHAIVIDYAGTMFPTLKITTKTLYRWRSLYRDPCDLLALVDRRGGDRRSMGSPEAWAELRRLYLSDHQPALRDVWKSVKRIAAENGWPWCSYKSCWSQLNTRIPPQDQTRHRDPAKYRSSLAPYITLDTESFKPGRLWIGDHKQLDLICTWRGQKIRPWLTAWMDWRTRKVVGYVLSDSPNSYTILAAFRHGLLDASNLGGPDEVWIDNGKDYASWVFHGTTKKERRVECRVNEAAAVGIFDGLGIKAHFAQPYNPNGKARLERWFGQLTSFARHFPTYTGISIDTKPESLAAVLKSPAMIPTFESVQQRVADFIAGENEDAEHSIADLAEHGVPLAPAEAFRRWVTSERRAVDPSAVDLFMNQWAKEVRVNRNGIAIAIRGFTVEYGQFDPLLAAYKAAKKADRRPLRVAFDPNDLRTIKVYRDDWSFLCTVEMNSVGGRSANAITADHLAETLKQQRRYTRARQDVNELAVTQILTNAELIAAAANPPPPPPAPPMSIRPVRTPLDGQSKAVERERLRKAAGAENQLHPDDNALSPFDLLNQYSSGPSSRHRGDDTPDLMAQLREQNREW